MKSVRASSNQSCAKRILDVTIAAGALILFAIPLIFVAALVVLTSPGPPLFRQTRIGRKGVPFTLFKFRTLPIEGFRPSISISGTVQNTRTGIFLRATKIDEIPQLFNVLRGEMSIVGPRPEIPEFVANYPAADKDFVLSVRPGLTDFASIHFRREGDLLASQADPLAYYQNVQVPAKLRYARFYVVRASLALDLYIIMLTAKYLMKDLAAFGDRTFRRRLSKFRLKKRA